MGSSSFASEDAGEALLSGVALLAGVTLFEDFAELLDVAASLFEDFAEPPDIATSLFEDLSESLTGVAELAGVLDSLETAEPLLAGVLDPLDFATGANDEEDTISSGVSMVIPWLSAVFSSVPEVGSSDPQAARESNVLRTYKRMFLFSVTCRNYPFSLSFRLCLYMSWSARFSVSWRPASMS